VSGEARRAGGEPIRDVMARYLRDRKVAKPLALNLPELKGMQGNPGMASSPYGWRYVATRSHRAMLPYFFPPPGYA